jgi:hypothetical protein
MAQTRQCDRLIETSLGGHRSRHGVKGGTEVQIDDYVHTVGRAIQPADPLSSGSSRLKRRPQRGPQARIGRPTRASEYSPGFRTHYTS